MWKTFLITKYIKSIQTPNHMYWDWCLTTKSKCISADYKPKIFI